MHQPYILAVAWLVWICLIAVGPISLSCAIAGAGACTTMSAFVALPDRLSTYNVPQLTVFVVFSGLMLSLVPVMLLFARASVAAACFRLACRAGREHQLLEALAELVGDPRSPATHHELLRLMKATRKAISAG